MSGNSLFPHSVEVKPGTASWWILADEQWEDSFQILDGRVGMRLVNKKVDFIIRPSFNHTTMIKYLSSDQNEGGEIRIDDEDRGFVSIIVPQPIVAAQIEPTITTPWAYMLRVLDRGPDFAWRPREIVRGPFWCYPGLTT